MASYHHKSGAQKRIEKQQRESAEMKGLRTLFDFGAYITELEQESGNPSQNYEH